MIPRWLRHLQRVAPSFGVLGTLVVGLCAWPYTVDDAYIVARYASRIAAGSGYTLSGKVASDGVTGPLWLLPAILASRYEVPRELLMKGLGLLLMAVSVGLVLRRVRARAQGKSLVLVALLLFLCQPTLGTWGVAGLETGAATLALTVALLAATARPRAEPLRAGLALCTFPWLRPELVPAGLVLLVWLARRVGARSWPAWALSLASLISVGAFRFVMFGDAVPLSFHAKHGELGDGAGYALRAAFVLAGGLGVVPIALARKSVRRDDRAVLLVLVAHALAVVLAGGDWMPGFRLFAPVLPAYVWLCAVSVRRLWRTQRMVMVLSLSLACAVPLLDLTTRVPDLFRSGRARSLHAAALASYLHVRANRVALVDIGYLGLYSGLEVVDLGGVTDPEIARLPGGHLDKRLPRGLLERRAPDVIILHSATTPEVDSQLRLRSYEGYPVEQRVAADPWVQARFLVADVVHYAPRYKYVVLLRDDRRPFDLSP